MVKINEVLNYKNVNYRRLSLTKVKSILIANGLFNKVENRKKIEIFAIPCKANINSPWIEFFTKECTDVQEFEKFKNEVEYYNCNNELGNYLHYYVKCKF